MYILSYNILSFYATGLQSLYKQSDSKMEDEIKRSEPQTHTLHSDGGRNPSKGLKNIISFGECST